MFSSEMLRPCPVPDGLFPSYAYLPGVLPHPIRHPAGHSYELPSAQTRPENVRFQRGADLFNFGYYWEAHEAWESIWMAAPAGSSRQMLAKGLILIAAAGLKIRQSKFVAAHRHICRGLEHFQKAPPLIDFQNIFGMSLPVWTENILEIHRGFARTTLVSPGDPEIVYNFFFSNNENDYPRTSSAQQGAQSAIAD